MAERLPVVGGDDGAWGTVLNNWLLKEHYDTNDGNTHADNGMHKGVTIRAGSTSVAPLTFTTTSAALLTTPAAGAVEVSSSGVLYYTQTTGAGNRCRVMYYDDGSAATGDVFYRDSGGNIVRLGIGSSSYVLTVNSGLPSWQPASGGGAPTDAQYVTLATNGTLSDERVLTGTSNKITITDGGAGSTATLNIGSDVVTLTDTQALTNKDITNATNTYRSASDTVTGAVELATTAETSTGTDAARAVTPDGLSGSVYGEKSYCLAVFESDTDVTTGDGKVGFCVPASMNGMDVVTAVATVHTAGTTGTTDIQIRRRRSTTDADILSTKITIDSTETSSTTAAAALAVNTSNDDLATGDLIFIDIDAVSTTKPKGLFVTVTARTP